MTSATSRTRARKLKIERLDAFLREAGPDITQRVIARRLTLKRRWAGDVRRAAHVRKEAVHLGGDVGPGEIGRAHVRNPVTNAQLVCPLLPEKKPLYAWTEHITRKRR